MPVLLQHLIKVTRKATSPIYMLGTHATLPDVKCSYVNRNTKQDFIALSLYHYAFVLPKINVARLPVKYL